MTEAWRKVWRDGFAPLLPTAGLEALKNALEEDDRRLIQGVTTSPPPLACVKDWDVEAACAVGYCFWKGDGLGTVSQVEGAFAKACFACDRVLGEAGSCRWFLNEVDDLTRGEMRCLLLPEVVRELERRQAIEKVSAGCQ